MTKTCKPSDPKDQIESKKVLDGFQSIVNDMESYCGWLDGSIRAKCIILGEEFGELMKAVRKREGMRVRKDSKIGSVEEEIADMIIVLCGIANRYGININAEVKNKVGINCLRRYK
jgi:NTP pyrophosphatase (non-canonical NTP hydrolase)